MKRRHFIELITVLPFLRKLLIPVDPLPAQEFALKFEHLRPLVPTIEKVSYRDMRIPLQLKPGGRFTIKEE